MQLQWGEPGREEQESMSQREQGVRAYRMCKPQYRIWILSSVRIPHTLQESPCVSGREFVSPLLSLFSTQLGAPKGRGKGLCPWPPDIELTLS